MNPQDGSDILPDPTGTGSFDSQLIPGNTQFNAKTPPERLRSGGVDYELAFEGRGF